VSPQVKAGNLYRKIVAIKIEIGAFDLADDREIGSSMALRSLARKRVLRGDPLYRNTIEEG
jgi:hypothetical protein